jgi:hypothetical protein
MNDYENIREAANGLKDRVKENICNFPNSKKGKI